MKLRVLVAHCILWNGVLTSAAYANAYDNEHRAHSSDNSAVQGAQNGSSDDDNGDSDVGEESAPDYSKQQQALEKEANRADEERSLKNFLKTLEPSTSDQSENGSAKQSGNSTTKQSDNSASSESGSDTEDRSVSEEATSSSEEH